jgi:hypothetical protein
MFEMTGRIPFSGCALLDAAHRLADRVIAQAKRAFSGSPAAMLRNSIQRPALDVRCEAIEVFIDSQASPLEKRPEQGGQNHEGHDSAARVEKNEEQPAQA